MDAGALGSRSQTFFIPYTPRRGAQGWGGEHFEKKSFFLEAVKSSLPVFPITSARVQKLPCRQPESPSSTGRVGPGARAAVEDLAFPRCPLAQTWAPPAKTNECQCYHRRRPDGRCPGRPCTATVNNPLPRPGVQTGLQSPWRQRLSGATAVRDPRAGPPVQTAFIQATLGDHFAGGS